MSRSLDTLLRPSLLAVAIALCTPLASSQLIAAEQASSVRAYNLPAASLASTLNQIASQSGFLAPGELKVRSFDTFSQPMAELIEARIWAGLHYRSADVAGQALGGNVANYAIANYFQPVGH